MSHSTVRSILDKLLLASLVAVVVTGVIVDQLDLNRFRLHTWSGYAMAALAAVHVGLHWRGRSNRTRTRSTPASSGTPAGRVSRHDEVSPADSASPAGGISRRTALASMASAAGGAALGWYTHDVAAPDPFTGGDVGLFYHQQSSAGVPGLLDAIVSWGSQPDRYKQVADDGVIDLPRVTSPPTMSLAAAIQQRRSLRDYADRPLTADELAWLVHAATGITRDDGLRTAPSAGALYPIETYAAVDRVDGIEPGLYHVDVRRQALEPVREGSVAGDVMLAGLAQEFLRDAPVVFALTGLFQRTRWKYHERHYRYVCWEAGHVAQNLYLAAEAAGLGACVVGAFFDGRLNDLLEIDGTEEAALGLVAVGPR